INVKNRMISTVSVTIKNTSIKEIKTAMKRVENKKVGKTEKNQLLNKIISYFIDLQDYCYFQFYENDETIDVDKLNEIAKETDEIINADEQKKRKKKITKNKKNNKNKKVIKTKKNKLLNKIKSYFIDLQDYCYFQFYENDETIDVDKLNEIAKEADDIINAAEQKKRNL